MNFSFVIFTVGSLIACNPLPKQETTPASVHEFISWEAKKQVAYFNRLSPRERMDFLAQIMGDGGQFSIGQDELKFFSDGIFVYDTISDRGFLGDNSNEGSFKWFIGHWRYEDGKIYLEDDNQANDILSDGYGWSGARAETFEENELLFKMNLIRSDSSNGGEESLFLENHLDSPAIRSYAEKKQVEVLKNINGSKN